ncbi:TIGR03067 domain-containing protein [Thermomonas sp.]|jgi:uncharacterized protein (TIGR03067 family)|uniref:TIGR03067 domain-containing protein n=1 Tax=Thermomonas sp. TaxID=1971895 RepID=UPI00257B5CFD|nr:TIGR03067 domain-containing protein [Thermomonas sp.]
MQIRVDEELKKFQGTWKQVKCEANGVVNPSDEFGSEPLTTFSGNTYVVTLPDGTVVIEGTFTLDPTQEPKAVNWTDTCGADEQKTFPSIYAFYDDQLIFCAADEGMERPKVFQTRQGETLRVHQRVSRPLV